MKLQTILSCFSFFILISCANSAVQTSGRGKLVQINDENWSQILQGEWMVEFFAPWCPACRSLEPVWKDFSTWSDDLGIKVAQVDITSSPGLSGRFMITALPTIYHVKEGVFRQYRGPRTKEDFLTFVEEKKWEQVDPLSSWQSPSSLQMSTISQFYRVSMFLRNVMNVMLEEYNIPSWAAYVIFGVATIVIGLILGLILVCIIDCIYPPVKASDHKKAKDDKDDDPVDDPIVDEEAENNESQAENGDEEGEEEQNPAPATPDSAAARRRKKTRLAD